MVKLRVREVFRTVHEFPITMSILSIVLGNAREAQASKITKISLTVGQLSGIVPECVELQFRIASKGTIAEGANLSFNRPSSNLRCRKCGTSYSADGFQLRCPNCGKQEFEVLSGRECLVENIEVE